MKTIYLASEQYHKLHELQTARFGRFANRIRPDAIGGMPEVEETGSTFEANALLKAHGREVGHDAWFLADDRGLRLMP